MTRILGISGSLRRDSFNSAALRAAQDVAPTDMQIVVADLSQIPLYDTELRGLGQLQTCGLALQNQAGARMQLAAGAEFAPIIECA